MPPAPAIAGDQSGTELLEHYWASLLRDVPFTLYASNTAAIQAAQETSGPGDDIDVALPPFYMPTCEPESERPEPLFDSRAPWLEQTRRLKEKRNLGGDNGDE